MRILAVDTTSAAGSVALLDGSELRALIGVTRKPGYAERLLPSIDQLLSELGLTLADTDGFAVAVGPGSFTGLRIGIATMEGLAYATGRPIAGVSSLEATAYRYRFRSGLVAAFLDARRGEVFAALYRSNGLELDCLVQPVCEPPERFLERLPAEPVLVAGTGTLVYRNVVSRVPGGRLQVAEPSLFLAEEVARRGYERLREGKCASLGRLEAVYLRPSDAERERQEKPSSGSQP